MKSHDEASLKVAWEIYAHVFRQIRKQLQDFDKLFLNSVSPELEKMHDIELHVPGTYLSIYIFIFFFSFFYYSFFLL
jgi:phosphatidylinositol kinase/protein kinase (PI-3  family)